MRRPAWPRRLFGSASSSFNEQESRHGIERLKSITAISDEMRDVIEIEWPELAAKLPPKGCAITAASLALKETPALVGIDRGLSDVNILGVAT
jgi:hypothetical protein